MLPGLLTALFVAAQAVLLGLVAWNLLTALPGMAAPPIVPPGGRDRRFRVVVAAHDEETVIGGLLADLAAQTYPTDRVRVVVVADRCTDHTADIARALGADVHERVDGPSGKGAALAWYLAREPLDEDETLVVFDADTRLAPDVLARLADHLDVHGRPTALQAYLDVTDPDAGILALASALSYWASNRMVQLARHRLGWPVDLGGTGMAVDAPLVALGLAQGAGLDAGEGLAEDRALTVRLALAGHPARWAHDVRIRDEKPTALDVAVRQRARWAAGKRAVARRHVPALLRWAVTARDLGAFDLAVRLVQPSRAFLALLTGMLAAVAALVDVPGLWPWWLWAAVAVVQLLAPLPFLAAEGVPGRYLWRYPLLAVFGALWPLVRLRAGRVRRWDRTPRAADGAPPPDRGP